MTNKIVQFLQDYLTAIEDLRDSDLELPSLQKVREFLEATIPELEKEIGLSRRKAHFIPHAGLYWVLLQHKDRAPSMGYAHVYHMIDMIEKDMSTYKRVEIYENSPFKSGEDRYLCGRCCGFGGEDRIPTIYDHYEDVKWMPITKPTLEELSNYENP